jgi:hypothetical protein
MRCADDDGYYDKHLPPRLLQIKNSVCHKCLHLCLFKQNLETHLQLDTFLRKMDGTRSQAGGRGNIHIYKILSHVQTIIHNYVQINKH